MKTCNICKTERPFVMFSLAKANKDGYQTRCKECTAAYYVANRAKVVAKQRENYDANREHRLSISKANYEANKDTASEYHKARRERLKDVMPAIKAAWYADNKDVVRAKQASYRKENVDACKARDAAYYAANKSKLRTARLEYAKAYRAANPHKTAAKQAKRRAALINATPPWVNYAEIAAFYEDAKTLETIFGWPFHVDHSVPLNHPFVSGLHVPANLQILNASDNLSKSNTFHI
jgi:hypothetical protein